MITALKLKKKEFVSSSVEKAKTTPILSLLIGMNYNPPDPYKTGKIMMLCPLHQETTPSFCIYRETNSWNCFAGCGGGSVIDLYMKLHDVDFKTAVERLNNG